MLFVLITFYLIILHTKMLIHIVTYTVTVTCIVAYTHSYIYSLKANSARVTCAL